MYCLIQFYYQLHNDLTEHKPFLKIVAIKLVIFLSFWQTVKYPCLSPCTQLTNCLFYQIIISFLTSTNVIKSSAKFAQPDIKIGIPSLLLCIEMAIFSVLHLYAYPWKVYDIRTSSIVVAESGPGYLPDPKTAYKGGFGGHRAYFDALNMWDLVKGVARGVRWIFVGRKTRELDVSYKGQVNDTALQPARRSAGSSYHGRNPASYQRLDEDMDEPQWSQQQQKQALGKPMPVAQSQETGIMQNRRYEQSPYRPQQPPQAAPGIQIRDENGQDIGVRNEDEYGHDYMHHGQNRNNKSGSGVGVGVGGIQAVDTGYHGAAEVANPGHGPPRHNDWPMGEGNSF